MAYGGRVRAATVVVTGIPQLDAKLKDIAIRVARKASTAALRAGMTIVAQGIRREVPRAETPGHGTEGLKRSIKGRQTRQRSTGIMTAKVGVKVGASGEEVNAHRWGKEASQQVFHLLALGTKKRYTGSKGVGYRHRRIVQTGNPRRYTGFVRPNAFVKRGFAGSSGLALTTMLKKADQVIQKEAAKR